MSATDRMKQIVEIQGEVAEVRAEVVEIERTLTAERDAARAETQRLREAVRGVADDLASAREAHLNRTSDFDGLAAGCGAVIVSLRALANEATR